MNKHRHLMLWGTQQVGKTTLINQILARHSGWTVKGFRTFTDFGAMEGAIGPIYIKPVQALNWYRQEDALIGIRRSGQRTTFTQVFEKIGPRILQDSCGADLLVMDEIGTMENDALAFQHAVLQAFSEETPIIGVMKGQSSPFMDAVRHHPCVRTLEITLDNREEMLKLADEFVSNVVISWQKLRRAPASGAESAPSPPVHR